MVRMGRGRCLCLLSLFLSILLALEDGRLPITTVVCSLKSTRLGKFRSGVACESVLAAGSCPVTWLGFCSCCPPSLQVLLYRGGLSCSRGTPSFPCSGQPNYLHGCLFYRGTEDGAEASPGGKWVLSFDMRVLCIHILGGKNPECVQSSTVERDGGTWEGDCLSQAQSWARAY